jgi:hypothetical protein
VRKEPKRPPLTLPSIETASQRGRKLAEAAEGGNAKELWKMKRFSHPSRKVDDRWPSDSLPAAVPQPQ